MGTKYSTISISGYNSSPPSDDGTAGASNQLNWSKHKTKIGDPLNAAIVSINSALVTALDQSVRTVSAADTTLASDHNRTIQIASTVTSSILISLGDAASMAAGYIVTVNNQSAVSCLVDCITATDTINNSTAAVPIASLESITFIINSAATGYVIKGRGSGLSSTIAAATVAAHATTANIWVAREITLTGGAVTFTDIADAPYVGAVAWVKQNAAHIWTDGAVFEVQGNANYTAVASDWIRVYATTISTFEITIFRADSNLLTQGEYDAGTDTVKAPTAILNRIALVAEVVAASQTSIDFTGIPAGTRRITAMFNALSTNGTSDILVQLGDAGGVEVTGYNGATINYSGATVYAAGAGFAFAVDLPAAGATNGVMILTLQKASTFTWSELSVADVSANGVDNGAGTKSLSAELNRVRITTVNGTDVFDAGSVSISLEK